MEISVAQGSDLDLRLLLQHFRAYSSPYLVPVTGSNFCNFGVLKTRQILVPVTGTNSFC